MQTIIESYTVEIHELNESGKLLYTIELSGNYNFFPRHPMQSFTGWDLGSEETLTIDKVKLDTGMGGVDITNLINNMVNEWCDKHYYKKLERLAIEHCRAMFSSETEAEDYTLNCQ